MNTTYDPNVDVDYADEANVLSKGRIVKVRLPDQDSPNVHWLWIPIGNCFACKYHKQAGSGYDYPGCSNKKITPAQFFDEYVHVNDCPEFEAGVDPKVTTTDEGRADFLDVMKAIGLVLGKSKQKVEVIVNEPWSISLSQRAHREQSIFLDMARTADSGQNDPNHGEYVDLSDDLERPVNSLKKEPDDDTALAVDAQGHQHKGKGAGGGQFAKTGDIDELDPVIRGDKKPNQYQHMHLYDLGYDKNKDGSGYTKKRDALPDRVRGEYNKKENSDERNAIGADSGGGGGSGKEGVGGLPDPKPRREGRRDKKKPRDNSGGKPTSPKDARDRLTEAGLKPVPDNNTELVFITRDDIEAYSEAVLVAADKAGLLIPEDRFHSIMGGDRDSAEAQDNDLGGGEHRVYMDEKNNRVLKITQDMYHTGAYGLSKDAHDYLRRMEIADYLWPSLGYKFEGVINSRGHSVIATTMNRMSGSPPAQGEIDKWFTDNGWEQTFAGDEDSNVPEWRDPKTGTIIRDTVPRNFIKTSGGLVPIDVDIVPGHSIPKSMRLGAPDAALALNPGEKYFDTPPKGKGWTFVRAGKLGGHIYRHATEGKAAPTPTAPGTTGGAAVTPEQVKAAHDVVRRVAGPQNLAPLVKVRRALADAGITDRAQQDAAIQELRRRGVVSASGIEGRHGMSAEEKEAGIKEGSSLLGYLSVRLSVDAVGHQHRGKGEGGGQFTGGGDSRGTALGKSVSNKTYFHGTWEKELKEFDPDKTRTGVVSFTDDVEHAEGFGSNVHKIKLEVKNPIDLRSLGAGGEGDEDDPGESVSSDDFQTYLADEYGIKVDLGKNRGFATELIRAATKEIKRQAIAKGYDAILVLDFKDKEVEEIQVFHKEQIKVVP